MLSEKQRAFLWTLALVLVPPARELSTEQRTRFHTLIEDMLSTRPKIMVRLVGIFLAVLRWAPLLRFGGRLDHLPTEQQIRTLRWFEECPLGTIRTGFWGVKTLVFLGYYGQPEIARANGWTPSRNAGNEKLHA